MRAFIVLCLVAVACADKLGYNYQPVGHSNSGLSFTPGAGSSLGDVSASSNLAPAFAADYSTSSNSAPSFAADYSASSNSAPSFAADYSTSSNSAPSFAPQGDYSASTNDAPSYAPQAEFDKEFYTYSANEDDFSVPAASNQVANSIKQALRVVFIKGPEHSGLENAAVALAKHASEQKTDIYVLQKQADLGHLANKLNTINKDTNSKPEVHFVKYRTSEDAINAQKAIKGQYDTLGGSSQSHDGGVAPVLNFASQAPAPAASHSNSVSVPSTSFSSAASEPAATLSSSESVSAPVSSYIPPAPEASAAIPVVEEPSNTYLPASILRLFRL